MKTQLCEFYVAGVQHHDLKTVISSVNKGDSLQLVTEPTNKFDPNAVKILFENDVMLGYVPMKGDLSATISANISFRTLYCEVLEINPQKKPWEQLKVEIYFEDEDEDEEEDYDYKEDDEDEY